MNICLNNNETYLRYTECQIIFKTSDRSRPIIPPAVLSRIRETHHISCDAWPKPLCTGSISQTTQEFNFLCYIFKMERIQNRDKCH